MKNFARAFAHLVSTSRRPKREPLEVRRSNTARRIVTVAYKPGPRLVLAGATPNIPQDIGPRRHAGILELAHSVTRRPYLRVERLVVGSAAAITY